MGFAEIWRGTANPDKYVEPQGAFLISLGENSGSCLGNTVTIPGDERKCSARDFECSMITETARRIGASLALGGAGGGSAPRAPGSCTCSSAPGSTKPWATTKDATFTARASNTPESASAALCVSSAQSFEMRLAARMMDVWMLWEGDAWPIIRARQPICSLENRRSANLAPPDHCCWCWSGSLSAIALRVLRM